MNSASGGEAVSDKPLTQPAVRFWRLPVIRHIRWVLHSWRVNRWYAMWTHHGYYENSDFDRRVLSQIWRGIV
jgi:hypothetical protein